MTVRECVHNGGLPDAWTAANLLWLAQAHDNLAKSGHNQDRAAWHRRWAAFCTDLWASRNGS